MLNKLIGLLLLLCTGPLFFVFENSKNTRNELARFVIGTIFLVMPRVFPREFDRGMVCS